jgi:hypothetical protein
MNQKMFNGKVEMEDYVEQMIDKVLFEANKVTKGVKQ